MIIGVVIHAVHGVLVWNLGGVGVWGAGGSTCAAKGKAGEGGGPRER